MVTAPNLNKSLANLQWANRPYFYSKYWTGNLLAMEDNAEISLTRDKSYSHLRKLPALASIAS